jgi:hypothetical protein
MNASLSRRIAMLFVGALLVSLGAAEGGFNKDELEALLKKEHSNKISNIYDPDTGVQYPWNIEGQELCPGVDGKCSKEEL